MDMCVYNCIKLDEYSLNSTEKGLGYLLYQRIISDDHNSWGNNVITILNEYSKMQINIEVSQLGLCTIPSSKTRSVKKNMAYCQNLAHPFYYVTQTTKRRMMVEIKIVFLN